MPFVTSWPATEPWQSELRAATDTDRVATALRYGDRADDYESLCYRISGLPGTWSNPNGRRYTETLEAVSVPEELYLRI